MYVYIFLIVYNAIELTLKVSNADCNNLSFFICKYVYVCMYICVGGFKLNVSTHHYYKRVFLDVSINACKYSIYIY